uniref:Uncharacterized protein n=1 Tax=Nelumbo nucifera TaxID=4432 RepID=A0A822XQL9_NELNU|nr:TPA_asm: hypothetical protein HUJ06_022862 [Nelumbo nucifera]
MNLKAISVFPLPIFFQVSTDSTSQKHIMQFEVFCDRMTRIFDHIPTYEFTSYRIIPRK